MAVKTIRVRVCDVCAREDSTARYRVSRVEPDPRTATVDLCEEHGAGVVTALEARPVAHRKQRAVTPMKEVTARKSRTKKAAKKA